MQGLFIELKCPKHGLERFTIKVKRKFNMPSNEIKLIFRSKPKPDLRYVLVGRNVEEKYIQSYIIKYLREKGLWERIITFKPV
ncbi:hypothetical protein DRO69_04015 [Candidatus Bathyarchaeota archaeon]|nr:MAG: hypothetical protein DRO69_04015 [Candidatus Bathyarchaeota archaeon]